MRVQHAACKTGAMKRERVPPVDRRCLRIPYLLLLARYGAVDEAEDDLLELLRQVLGADVAVSWEEDLRHPNPWFHTVILDVGASLGEFSHAQHGALMERLRALDLA
ncbi:hypothetical protein [Stenotrophomonas sp. P5_B8]